MANKRRRLEELDDIFQSQIHRFTDDQDVLDWIVRHFEPEEVYGLETLKEWAKDHGYVLPLYKSL